MTLQTAKIVIAVLGVALVGSLFLNFNQESENRDLCRKIDQLVNLTKEYQMEKEHLEFQGSRMENELTNMALRQKEDSIFSTGRSQRQTQSPQNNTPTNPIPAPDPTMSEPNPAVIQPPAQGQGSYPKSTNTGGFEDMNKKH